MKENENVKNQDDALNDTVNPDMENKQENAEEQPAAESNEAPADTVSDKKSKRFKIRHSNDKKDLEVEKAK